MDPARATTHPPAASAPITPQTTPTTRDSSKRRRALDENDDSTGAARVTLVTALVAACACACVALVKRAFDGRRGDARSTRDARGTEVRKEEDFSTSKGAAAAADDPVKKRLSFSGMSASSLASGGEEEESSRVTATRADRIEEETTMTTTTANGASTNGTKSLSAASTPTRDASREKRERQTPTSPSKRPAMKLEVLGGASQGATFVASLGVDEFTVGRGRVNKFVVESVEVSTVHAKFRWDGAAWTMRDLGSLNGTRVNGSTISGGNRAPGPWQKITHGDVIKLGERDSSPRVSVSFFRDVSVIGTTALTLPTVVRVEGAKPTKSEDRVLVECPLRGNPSVGVFCVFDGHGGSEAAERARHLFPEVIARRLGGKVPDHEGVRELLESSFIESDETMAVEYEGCTASVVLVWRDALSGGLMFQAANVGDSSVAYGRAPALNGDHGARYITPEHKVRHAEERNRLNRAGAELPPEATRLYGLALSRALGDKFLKDQNVGLIAHPFVSEVVRVDLKSQDFVLTIASDGLWDVFTPEEVYDVMREAPDGCLHAASQSLILNARRRRSVDDISFIAVRLWLEKDLQ